MFLCSRKPTGRHEIEALTAEHRPLAEKGESAVLRHRRNMQDLGPANATGTGALDMREKNCSFENGFYASPQVYARVSYSKLNMQVIRYFDLYLCETLDFAPKANSQRRCPWLRG